MVCHHQISSPCECRRMMRPKPLEVTRTFLTTCYTSLCYNCRRNPYSLSKSLLIKYRWLVKCRWCLTSTSWMHSTSSPSTSHLLKSNGRLNSNSVSLRLKHNPETLFIHRMQFIHSVLAFKCNVRQLIHISNQFYPQKFYFRIFHFFKLLSHFI